MSYLEALNILEPTQELHSRAVPSAGGNITAKSVQPQGEIPELGRTKKGKMTEFKKVMGEITKRSFYRALSMYFAA